MIGTDNLPPEDMNFLAKRWWAVALRGIITTGFGVLACTLHGADLSIVVSLLGVYAIADGFLALLTVAGESSGEHRWPVLLEGILTAWAGAFVLRVPSVSETALLLFFSIFAMGTGSLRIVASFQLRQEIAGEVLLALSGIVAVLFALILMLYPVPGATGLRWAIGAYVIVLGILQALLGSELFYFRTLLSARERWSRRAEGSR